MCVAVPGRVVALGPEGARVEVRGRLCTASTLLMPEVQVGDCVIISGGVIVARLDEEEARARLELFDSLLEVLDERS